MTLFLAVTGLAGFLTSALLHAAGLSSMAIRYPVAVGVAYLVFLLLLSSFVAYHRARRRQGPVGSCGPDLYYWHFGPAAPADPPVVAKSPAAAPGQGNPGGGFNLGGGDGDGIAVVVVVVLICVAVGAAIFASALLLVEAPVLLAEILVDGVLVLGLARRMDPTRSPHWVSGALRRSILPLVVVAFCFAAVGFALEYVVPGATTMGEALHMARPR